MIASRLAVGLQVLALATVVRIHGGKPVLLGYSLVWPKAAVFEIVIVGSNPTTPAKTY